MPVNLNQFRWTVGVSSNRNLRTRKLHDLFSSRLLRTLHSKVYLTKMLVFLPMIPIRFVIYIITAQKVIMSSITSGYISWLSNSASITAQKTKFSIKDFYSKCDQIHRKVWIWSHLVKKSLIENLIFCAVNIEENLGP